MVSPLTICRRLFRSRPTRLALVLLASGVGVGCSHTPKSFFGGLWGGGKTVVTRGHGDCGAAGCATDACAGSGRGGGMAAADGPPRDPFLGLPGEVDRDEHRGVAQTASRSTEGDPPIPPLPKGGQGGVREWNALEPEPATPSSPDEPEAEFNPFENLANNNTAPRKTLPDDAPRPETASEFAEDYDSQLNRLRQAMKRDTQAAPKAAPQAPPMPAANELEQGLVHTTRQRVDDLMHRAHIKLSDGRIDDALRLARQAEQLALDAGLLYGPGEVQPADLVARVERQLETRAPVRADFTAAHAIPAAQAEDDWSTASASAPQELPGVELLPAPAAEPLARHGGPVDSWAQEEHKPLPGMIVSSETVPRRFEQPRRAWPAASSREFLGVDAGSPTFGREASWAERDAARRRAPRAMANEARDLLADAGPAARYISSDPPADPPMTPTIDLDEPAPAPEAPPMDFADVQPAFRKTATESRGPVTPLEPLRFADESSSDLESSSIPVNPLLLYGLVLTVAVLLGKLVVQPALQRAK
ncbi:MAG: hypothetical protein KY476_03910 [Planctomycetes bacterium]|nr:hypothetical protein [Planctomycetota bacterium]